MSTSTFLDVSSPAAPRLSAFVRPRAAAIALGVICAFGASACYVAVPPIIRHALDALAVADARSTVASRRSPVASLQSPVPGHTIASGVPDRAAIEKLLLACAGLLVACGFARAVFNYYMRWLIVGASRTIERDLRDALFAHLQTLPAGYFDRTRSGDLLSRSINDIEGIRMMLGAGALQGASTVSMAIFCIGGMLWIDWRWTLMALVPLLGAALLTRFFGDRVHRLSTDVQEHLSTLSNRAQENFSGARVIKSYAQEAHEEAVFDGMNRAYLDKNLALAREQGLVNSTLAVLGEIGVAIAIWFGGVDILRGEATLGDLVAFTAFQFMLVWPMIALGWILNLTQRGIACWERVAEVLKEQGEVGATLVVARTAGDARVGAQHAAPLQHTAASSRVEFRNLTFAYPGSDRTVLREVSFTIEPGRLVAVVGRTGAGKSTLAHLLARFYPVPRGMILVDGVDLNDIPIRDLRDRLGYVPQETFLFSEPIRDNIRFANPEASDEAVLMAATMSHLWPDIQDFPEKMGQLVGERGVTLSGGQKQRTALARVIAKDPRIVVLDDVFASVDTHTEAAILAGLKPFLAGRTTLQIAHRIATVRSADRIVVIDEGRVVEQGTHAELLKKAGAYAAMAEQQSLEEALEEAN